MDAPPPYPGPEPSKGPPPPAGYNYSGVPPPPPGQPQGYYPPQQQGTAQTNTVVIAQPVVATTLIQQFRQTPIQTVCPHCRANIVTRTVFEVGGLTWLVCFIIAIMGCWLGCCFIPFCIDECKDVVHICPNCNGTIGRFNRL